MTHPPPALPRPLEPSAAAPPGHPGRVPSPPAAPRTQWVRVRQPHPRTQWVRVFGTIRAAIEKPGFLVSVFPLKWEIVPVFPLK